MAGRLTIQNVIVGILTALVIFMGGWVLDTNTKVALLDQRIANEEKSRQSEYNLLRRDMAESKENYSKMADTMGKLDKTLSLLVDRLDRGDLTVRREPSHIK